MTDPRNDRPSADDDRFDDRPCCGICDRAVTPANFGAWDRWDVFCVDCRNAAELAYPAGDDGLPTDEEYHRPMTTGEAMAMAVESAMGGRTLLNGRDPHDDGLCDCPADMHEERCPVGGEDAEESTVEVVAPSMAELMDDLRRRGAA
ncbi:MAG: hypothetical protein EPN98_21650 [Phenylobacterium sp.]|uniref:hypothetical protein n=1 Tax=Phenylobacterium sp. TaxID=1871053 RepID=UPI0012127A5D|nr:hypothetical protein [Phenylobacterium sp.]TAL29050.1 MAG: hypothetical protein EPN98_21650 [Phenylobacterium sp.]